MMDVAWKEHLYDLDQLKRALDGRPSLRSDEREVMTPRTILVVTAFASRGLSGSENSVGNLLQAGVVLFEKSSDQKNCRGK